MSVRVPDIAFRPRGLYIGGAFVAPREGGRFTTIDPATLQPICDVPHATDADVNDAVAAAGAAAPAWARTPIRERAKALEALAGRIRSHADELALMDAVDSGNTITGMRADAHWAADAIDFFAGLVTEIKGESSSHGPRHLNVTRRQPYGVVAKINPFNHPFRFCAEKAAAPLAAGNCVIVKGSEQAPLSSLRLAELADGLFPPGVFNVVAGDGATGAALVKHPDVPRIGFVGSVPTGRTIARAAADGLKHVTLELGGKNPIVIFPDADPKQAAMFALKGMNMSRQGQSCSSTSRVLVHASLHDAVLDELAAAIRALRVGLPWDPATEVGAIVSQRQFDRVMSFVEAGKNDGARLIAGGARPSDPELRRGLFVMPTLFDGVTPDMRIAREEIFGPVMSVMTWSDEEAMLNIANGLEFGLTAAIVTNDFARAMETAERLDAGYVWVNANGRYLGAPYGGWKQSGIGAEECIDELLAHTRVKNLHLRW